MLGFTDVAKQAHGDWPAQSLAAGLSRIPAQYHPEKGHGLAAFRTRGLPAYLEIVNEVLQATPEGADEEALAHGRQRLDALFAEYRSSVQVLKPLLSEPFAASPLAKRSVP